MTTRAATGTEVALDRRFRAARLWLVPRETANVRETPGMSLFWEEMLIDPPHSPERCPRGRNDHFVTCYGEMPA